MAINKIVYPIDLTGNAQSNRIQSEPHVIGQDRYRAFALNYGPFFAESVVVVDAANGRRLTRQVDYEILYTIPELVKATRGKEVAGVVIITNRNVSTNVTVTYNIVGGHFASNVYVIQKAIDDLNLDNRNVYWMNIIEKPELFQPAPHDHDFGDVYGLEFIITMLGMLNDSIVVGNSQVTDSIRDALDDAIKALTKKINDHAALRNNPHNVTASQVNCFDKEEINALIATINEALNEVDKDLASIARDISNIVSDIDSINQSLVAMGESINDVLQTFNNINLTIANFNDRLDGFEQDITQIKQQITLLIQRDEELNQLIIDTNSRVDEVVNITNELKQEIENIGDTNNNVNIEIDTIKRDYLPKSEVNNENAWSRIINRVPRITGQGVFEAGRYMDWHTNNSVADYDLREELRWNGQFNSYEIYNSHRYSCVDINIRSDIRDKTDIEALDPLQANEILTELGFGITYNLAGSLTPTAGLSAQQLKRVYPHAVGETVNSLGLKRLTVSSSPLIALLVSGYNYQSVLLSELVEKINTLTNTVEQLKEKE